MGRLDGRIAIVTGGGRGIGQGIVERFAAEGARIVIATRTASAGEEAAHAARVAGGEAIVLGMDVGSPEGPGQAVDEAVARWGRLDIIVHNAAYIPYEPLAGMDDAVFARTFETNVGAGLRFLRHALPHLEQHGSGRLLFTSSTAATGPTSPGLGAYAMSKAGLEGFVRGAAVELASRRVTVNAVAPGATLTHAMQQMMTPETIASLKSKAPLGRLGSPADVAAAMLFLASDDGAYVTGQVIHVEGGQTLKFDLAIEQDGQT